MLLFFVRPNEHRLENEVPTLSWKLYMNLLQPTLKVIICCTLRLIYHPIAFLLIDGLLLQIARARYIYIVLCPEMLQRKRISRPPIARTLNVPSRYRATDFHKSLYA